MAIDKQQPEWLVKVTKKKQIQADAIRTFLDGYAPPKSLNIVTAIDDVSRLATLIAEGKFSAREVVECYCYKSVYRHSS